MALSLLVLASACTSTAVSQERRAAEVDKSDGENWRTTIGDEELYSGPDMIAAIQAAADGLTSGRDWKETVNIRASGTVTSENSSAVHLPAYTVLDFHDNTVHARGGSIVTIQNLRISDCPWGIRETLPRTNNNRILNNDLRGNENCLEVQGEGTVAANNLCD